MMPIAHARYGNLVLIFIQAAEAAVPTTDAFAASMHWGTFRASMTRHPYFYYAELTNICSPSSPWRVPQVPQHRTCQSLYSKHC